jgi:hypothetical protein
LEWLIAFLAISVPLGLVIVERIRSRSKEDDLGINSPIFGRGRSRGVNLDPNSPVFGENFLFLTPEPNYLFRTDDPTSAEAITSQAEPSGCDTEGQHINSEPNQRGFVPYDSSDPYVWGPTDTELLETQQRIRERAATGNNPNSFPVSDEVHRPHVDIESMSGTAFEGYVAAIFRGQGYSVEMTKASGDFGVDLVIQRSGRKIAVQCKRQAKPVSGKAIQEVVGGAAMYDCNETMVVSNQVFTPAATSLAKRNSCQLVDGAELKKMISNYRAGPSSTVPRAVIAARKGNWERAEKIAAESTDGGDSYAQLAYERLREPNQAEARRLTALAYRHGHDRAFLELATSIREIGADKVRQGEYLEGGGRFKKSLKMKETAQSYFLEAKGLLDYAFEIKGKTESPDPTETEVIRERIDLLAAQRHWGEAESLAKSLPDGEEEVALVDLVIERARAGDWQGAESLARSMRQPGIPLYEASWELATKSSWFEAEHLADAAAEFGEPGMQNFLDSTTDLDDLERRISNGERPD